MYGSVRQVYPQPCKITVPVLQGMCKADWDGEMEMNMMEFWDVANFGMSQW